MRPLAYLSSMSLLLCLACPGGGSEDDDGTTTMPSGTTGTDVATGSTTAGTTDEPPDDTTGPGPTTTTTQPTSADGSSTSGDDDPTSSDTSAGGEPGDWLLTVDRGSSPPRLIKAGLTGGTAQVCSLAGSVDYTTIAFARDGTLYGLNALQNRIDVINPCNCSFQLVGPTSLGPISLSPGGVTEEGLLGLYPDLDALVHVDVETGLGTVVGPLGYLFEASAIAWSDDAVQPYAVEASNDYLYSIDVATGAATPLVPIAADIVDPGLAVHPNDGALYLCDGDTLYSLDAGTGGLTAIGPLGLQGGCRTLAVPQTAVACIDSL
ncbi:hypothetical protein [Paraliomyxa miuraensis]|uniref:hypothetical protein n=1 Tax=Paraliomyxa miuraensis TaxID=376150 RepID=UPI002257292E|nr:hypothetical protein [Paraliomyxa miuraensis]MCX4246202.1 hypothetical protein [Paraliomyxa miuraensis]